MKNTHLAIAAAAAVGLFFVMRRANAGVVAPGVFDGTVPVSSLPERLETSLAAIGPGVNPESYSVSKAAQATWTPIAQLPKTSAGYVDGSAITDVARIRQFIGEGLEQGRTIGATVKQVLDKARDSYKLSDAQIEAAGYGNLLH